MREKLPLEDPSETHGLCTDHFHSLRAGVQLTMRANRWWVRPLTRLRWILTGWVHRRVGCWLPLC